MREIKFRAWDEGNKVMHHNFQFITSGNEGDDWILFTSDEAPYEKDRKEGVVLNNPYFRQQLKIMQFTGLHDKNGKEIWEGDILIDHKRKYICSWKKEETAFVIYGEDKYKNTTIGHRAGSGKWVQRYFVVIGNIYENPELIEVSP